MSASLPPHRVDEMIATAVRRGRRTRVVRRGLAGLAAVGVVAGLAVGTLTLVEGPGGTAAPVPATPFSSPSSTPSSASPAPSPSAGLTELEPDPTATTNFFRAYSESEQQLILQHVSAAIGTDDPSPFVATVSRTTWADGLAVLSPDVEITGADDSPAFIVRLSGPLGNPTTRGPFESTPGEIMVGTYSLLALDGPPYMRGALLEVEGGPEASMVPIDTRYERDAAVIPLDEVTLPVIPTEIALSPEDEARALEVLGVLAGLLPESLRVDSVDARSANSAAFTLTDLDGTVHGSVNIWHLTPSAEACASSSCFEFPAVDGTVYVDAEFHGGVRMSRTYTYRRTDDAAINLTFSNVGNEGAATRDSLPLTDEQVINLLTDQAWLTILDRAKSEPPQ